MNFIYRVLSFLMAMSVGLSAHALSPMSTDELGAEFGQGLIVAETIQGTNVTSGLGTGDWSGYTYTRMGLDATLSMNANIDKMQLGCGGFNESILSNSCDIDMDYVRFMGRNGNAPCSVSTTTTDPCYGGGDFKLTRPYIEIATKGTGNSRELVGVKVGAQTTDGYFGVGRNYANGQTNLENGGTCGTTAGNAALACHSGINTISGYLHVEMSAQVDTTVQVVFNFNEVACFGNTSQTNDNCGVADTYYKDLVGTRMTQIRAPSTQLKLSGGFLSAIGISSAYADLTENFRFIHGFALASTQNFGLSFQRQKIAYPNYDKTSYSYPANAGWWMDVPDVKAVDIVGAPVTIGIGQVGSALGEPGLPLTNIELNSVAPSNCWGASKFC